MEEEIVDFYFPLTKNSMQKHQQFFPTLVGVMDPVVSFFESKDGLNCMATIYGYERDLTSSYDDKFATINGGIGIYFKLFGKL